MVDLVTPLSTLIENALASRHQTQAGKRLAYHTVLREGLKEVPAALSKLDALLVEETESFCAREEYLLRRKFNLNFFVGGLFALAFSLLAALLDFALTVQSWASGWGYLVFFVLTMVTGIPVLVTIGFFRSVYRVSPTQTSSTLP